MAKGNILTFFFSLNLQPFLLTSFSLKILKREKGKLRERERENARQSERERERMRDS